MLELKSIVLARHSILTTVNPPAQTDGVDTEIEQLEKVTYTRRDNNYVTRQVQSTR